MAFLTFLRVIFLLIAEFTWPGVGGVPERIP